MELEARESFCIVERGVHRLALTAGAVRRVLSGGTMTRVPGAPAQLVGLVDDHGSALPVIRLDDWLGLSPRACTSGDAVVVVEGDGLRFGVLVDRVEGVALLAETLAAGTADWPELVAPELIAVWRRSPRGPVGVLSAGALAQAAVAAADRAFARARARAETWCDNPEGGCAA
jgi:chemotaxis signal transduction protein